MRDGFMHVGQWSVFRSPHATVRPEEDGLLNIDIGSNMIGAKCCLQTNPDSVWIVTPDMLVWRERDTRNNPAFVPEGSQYRRAGWMVWGGISIGGHTDLHSE